MRFQIQSGQMRTIIEAADATAAAKIAVQNAQRQLLGVLTEIIGPDGEPEYIATQFLLDDAPTLKIVE